MGRMTSAGALGTSRCSSDQVTHSVRVVSVLRLIGAKLSNRSSRREGRCHCMCRRRGGLLAATPVTRICSNLLICLIHSGLISRRKKKKEREKRKKAKSDLQRKFHHHQEPKSGHNLCFHKSPPIISPCVLHVSPFSMLTPVASQKSLPVRFSWCPSGCLTVLPSVLRPNDVFPPLCLKWKARS